MQTAIVGRVSVPLPGQADTLGHGHQEAGTRGARRVVVVEVGVLGQERACEGRTIDTESEEHTRLLLHADRPSVPTDLLLL